MLLESRNDITTRVYDEPLGFDNLDQDLAMAKNQMLRVRRLAAREHGDTASLDAMEDLLDQVYSIMRHYGPMPRQSASDKLAVATAAAENLA